MTIPQSTYRKPTAADKGRSLGWGVDPGVFTAAGDLICAEIYELNAEARYLQHKALRDAEEQSKGNRRLRI